VAEDVAVLDFGSGKITVLIGRRGVNDTVCVSGVGYSEYEGFSDGSFVAPENVAEAVMRAFSTARTAAQAEISHLFIGVPGQFTTSVCRSVSMSLNKKRKVTFEDLDALNELGDDFKNNKEYTLINNQPVYYTLDSDEKLIQPVGLISSRLGGEISYILAEREFTLFMDGIMHAMGVSSYDFISSLLCEILLLFDDVERDGYVVLIDAGHISTDVAVARGDGIVRQFCFPLGGGFITYDLLKYLDIPFFQAEALKKEINLSLNADDTDIYTVSLNRTDVKKFSAKAVNEIVKRSIKAFADTVALSLKQCGEFPEHIPYHLTGGGIAYIKGARDLLAKYLLKPVEIAEPKIPQFNRPHLSAPVGLLDFVLKYCPPEKKRGFFARLFFGK
jgi:cell division protein FtsA